MSNLSKIEKETHIWMDDTEPKVVHIETYQRRMINKLRKIKDFNGNNVINKHYTNENIGITGTFPRRCLQIGNFSTPKNLNINPLGCYQYKKVKR